MKKIITTVLLLFATAANAVDPRLNWNTITSEHFYIHYADGYERLAQKTANSAEQAHAKLQPIFNWQPKDKTHLVVSDETDSANGFATPLTFNRSVLFMSPPDSANTLEDFDDWLETLITHEYTHILHLDKTSGGAKGLRNIFGRHFLLFPNAYQPNWFVEGLSTYHETDKLKGIGRGQSSVFKMMMRNEVENGIKPVSQVNLPLRSWPIGAAPYLYGVHFYQFIEETRGKKGIEKLINNYSNNIIPFMINTNTQQMFGKDVTQLWAEFSAWLNKRYQPMIESQKAAGLVEGNKITNFGYRTNSVDVDSDDAVYFVANGAFDHAQLMKRTGNKTLTVSEVSNGAIINAHAQSGVLVTQQDFCDEYNINSDIYLVEKGDDSIKQITYCGRYRSATWTADGQSIIAVKSIKGRSQLVLLNKKGEKIKDLWRGNNTDVVSQIKISPKGNAIVAAVFRTSKGWNIEEFNLQTLKWAAITNDRYIDMYPSYTDNGEAILFSSERSGRYQIYRYEKNHEQIKQLTRVADGAFNPVQFNQQSPLYYVGYNNNGRDIYELKKVKSLASTPLKTNKKSTITVPVEFAPTVETSSAESYSALSTMLPRWWFPFVFSNEDRSEYGITTSGNDALGIHNYFLTAAVDITNEWLVGNISYAYANRFAMGYQRSTDIFRDTAGEFAVARNVDDLFMSLGYSFPGVENSISFQLGGIISQSTDGNRAPGIAPQPDIKDNLLGGAILFNNTQNYIRSISRSDGRDIRLLAETTEVFDSGFSGEVYTLDWREFLHLGNQHVLAVRLVQGWGTDRPRQFRLGGEDNDFSVFNIINPISDPLFDKRDYALRGYAEGLPQLSGRRMQMATLEWRFPGTLIERGFMSPPLGIIQWSGNIFAETGAAYDGSAADVFYSSVGTELQADVNLFYGLTTRMSLGFARGLDSDIGENRFYFNLGAAF